MQKQTAKAAVKGGKPGAIPDFRFCVSCLPYPALLAGKLTFTTKTPD
jgi:hypothetical protein